MSKLLKKDGLVFSVGAYTIVNIINKSIPFLLLSVLTNYLSPADFGILTNIESLLVIAVTIIGINLPAAISRQYVKEGVDLKSYVKSAIRVVGISFLIVSIVFTGFADLIYDLTAVPKEILYVISVYAIMDTIMEAVLAIWRMEEKPFKYGILRISRTVIEFSASLILVMAYKYGWFGRFSGIYIAGILGGIFSTVYLFKKGYFKSVYKTEYKTHFLKYGLPLVPHSISGVLIFYSDKIVITKMIGIDNNGLYSVAFTIGMAISLLQNSFNQAWVPWLFKKLALNSEKENVKLVKITYGYMVIMLVFVLLLWLITPVIYMFLGEDFKEGMGLVAIIGLGFAFNGMYKMMVNYMFYAEKTKIISTITICIAIINIGLNILFIKWFGLTGSAYASALSFFIQFILTWYIGNKVYPMPWFKLK